MVGARQWQQALAGLLVMCRITGCEYFDCRRVMLVLHLPVILQMFFMLVPQSTDLIYR